ncbi:MAG: hypothetical protein NTZ64_15775 [Polaromonas sp.]|nr:hypothetical protein [Polaromonas sp.]
MKNFQLPGLSAAFAASLRLISKNALRGTTRPDLALATDTLAARQSGTPHPID